MLLGSVSAAEPSVALCLTNSPNTTSGIGKLFRCDSRGSRVAECECGSLEHLDSPAEAADSPQCTHSSTLLCALRRPLVLQCRCCSVGGRGSGAAAVQLTIAGHQPAGLAPHSAGACPAARPPSVAGVHTPSQCLHDGIAMIAKRRAQIGSAFCPIGQMSWTWHESKRSGTARFVL